MLEIAQKSNVQDWRFLKIEPSLGQDPALLRRDRCLPAVPSAATTIHDAGFETIGEAYTAIGRWIEASGYHIDGPAREVYLTMPGQGVPVVEIQFPIERS